MRERVFAEAALLILATTVLAVEKVPYVHAAFAFSDASGITHVDDRLQRDGSIVSVIANVDYDEPQYLSQTKLTANSFTMRASLNCKTREIKVSEMTFYDADDKELFTDSSNSAQWQSTTRESQGAKLVAYGCRKRR